jgi:cell division septal protein FtsQ
MAHMTDRNEQRRRARRTAIVLMLVALAVYGGFIWMSVHRVHG